VARRKAEKRSRQSREAVRTGRHRQINKDLEARNLEPEKKRCSLCQVLKSVEGFYTRRVKLKSGAIVQRVESWCKECTKERQKAYRKRQGPQKGGWASYREKLSGAKLERYLEKQRQRSTAYRRRNGSPPGTPRIPPRKEGLKKRVPVEPLAVFLESKEKGSTRRLACISGVDERRFTAILKREIKDISLRVVDEILVGLHCAEELATLYPLQQPRVGYRVISLPKA
jgi:hypothetical protein